MGEKERVLKMGKIFFEIGELMGTEEFYGDFALDDGQHIYIYIYRETSRTEIHRGKMKK